MPSEGAAHSLSNIYKIFLQKTSIDDFGLTSSSVLIFHSNFEDQQLLSQKIHFYKNLKFYFSKSLWSTNFPLAGKIPPLNIWKAQSRSISCPWHISDVSSVPSTSLQSNESHKNYIKINVIYFTAAEIHKQIRSAESSA